MRRLVATMICDALLQFRNGFYFAAAVVALFWIIAFHQFSPDRMASLMPAFILSNLLISTFYFMAGLVLLEKGEGTLIAQIASPLRDVEYLAAKVVTLSILAVVENLLIVLTAYGKSFHPVLLVAGILSASALLVLFGFITVCRYDSINEYLFPSFVFTLPLIVPFIHLFGLWKNPIFYLHPLQPSIVLITAASEGAVGWDVVYATLYSIAWIIFLFHWSGRELRRFAMRVEGGA